MKDATYWRKTLEENMNDPDALSRNKVELAGLVFYATGIYIGGVIATGKWIWW